MKPPHINLTEEHQSKALLIKFAWVMISGLCLLFICAMQWDDTSRLAYILSKIGVAYWLIGGFGMLKAGVVWLAAKDRYAAVKATWALMVLGAVWLLFGVLSWFETRNALMLIDVGAAGITCLCLVLSYVYPISHERLTIRKLAMANGIAWTGSGLMLLFAAIVWVSRGVPRPWITSGLLSLLALLIGCCCFAAAMLLPKDHASPRDEDNQTEKATRESDRKDSPLTYVLAKTDLIAVIALAYCGIAILGSPKLPFSGPTVVTALLGFASALTAMKIRTDPVFKDRVKVFCSPVGTQYIYPEQILVEDQLREELLAFDERERERMKTK